MEKRIDWCGNHETEFPQIKEKLRFVMNGASFQPIDADKKNEIREMQKFLITMDIFTRELSSEEIKIFDTYIDTWDCKATATIHGLRTPTVEKIIDKVQSIALHEQFLMRQKNQPLSAGLRVLGARVYDDGFQTMLETDWSYENRLALRSKPPDDYQSLSRFNDDEAVSEIAFEGASIRTKV